MSRYLRHLPCALFLLCSLAWVFPAVNETIGAMTDASQNMEYVWLVPVLAAAVLWARRKPLLASLGAPNPLAALPLILVAAAFFFLGARGGQSRFIQTAAVLLLLAAPLACYGKSAFKVAWFPIILLAFVMPVGFLDNFTVPLRKASVTVTAVILNGLGIEVHQQGTAIISTGVPPFQLDVADPCSGIRSLVALFVGTAAYGAFMLRGVWRRWALFLSSLPIAFLGNILRLLLTAFTCKLWGQSAGMVLHDNALFIVAPVYALCVFWLADRLRRNDKTEVPTPTPPPPPSPRYLRFSVSLLCVLACALPTFRAWVGTMPEPVYEDADFIAPDFAPLERCTLRYPWFCQGRDCPWEQAYEVEGNPPESCPLCGGHEFDRMSRAERDILPADTTTRKAIYTLPDGTSFTIAVVIAGHSRRSIHRPELCLPAQGYILSERDVRDILPGVPVALFSIHREQETRMSGFAYVFLNSDGATVSNLRRVVGDTLERSLHNRIRRWAMVTIRCDSVDFRTPEGEETLRRFMQVWWPTLWAEGKMPHD